MRNYTFILCFICLLLPTVASAQVGYYDAPYVRYEADLGTLSNAFLLPKSFAQSNLQSEASEQVCVNMTSSGASVSWTVTSAGDGLVVRYSVPDGQSATLDVYANSTYVGTLNLTTYYSWEYLSTNGNPNNAGVSNNNPKMRFDEVRMKLPSPIAAGGNLKLVRQSGNIYLDFAELELVPAAVPSSAGNLLYSGNGSDLQTVINNNGGATIYLPPGVYNVNNELYFGVNNTVLKGAGSWYTEIHFTNNSGGQGGLRANASNISYSGLYLTTVRNSRSNSYKSINGVYTSGSTITDVWAEHFECGAWIAQYNTGGPSWADGFRVSNCRFRDNYADGFNLCKGTRNAIVEHCSFRNNGDDDMAIWSAENLECQNNTFRYNTSENCWRASGCAIYGGLSNKAYNLLIQDNVEVGIRVNNAFGGAPFNSSGMHEFSNIIIKRCGTYNDLFNQPVGAIDLGCYDWGAGTRVQNVKFSCINIIDSKNDAIYMNKVSSSSDGFYNLVFENITVNGTGREYPGNDVNGVNGVRGYGLLFKAYPNGYGTYCNMTYSNRGGNAPVDVQTAEKGSFSWTVAGSCPGGCSLGSGVVITSPVANSSYTGCPVGSITINATATASGSDAVSDVEFFVDGTSIGTDNTSPYSIVWNSPTDGVHALTAVAHYAPSNTTSSSSPVSITVGGDIKQTSTAPVIDGTVDAVWNNYISMPLTQGYNNPPDLAASYKIMYDAVNLYVLVDVTDNMLWNDSPDNWNDDGIELYIDFGNDKAGTYGSNDFQYSFEYNSTVVTEYKHSPASLTGVAVGNSLKSGGYIMEIKLPWSTIGSSPAPGSFLGFDVKVNDDDDGGDRDHQLSWNDGSFMAYNNTALFGTLQFASCGPLPVTWLSFNGDRYDGTVMLQWSTAQEFNTDQFVVERSVDSEKWTVIGEVKAQGYSGQPVSYHFNDLNVPNEKAYYRLKQLDIDQRFSYSSIILITEDNLEGASLYPNPFQEVLYLTLPINEMGEWVEIELFDLQGKTCFYSRKSYSSTGIQIEPQLASGMYIAKIRYAQKQVERKVFKP